MRGTERTALKITSTCSCVNVEYAFCAICDFTSVSCSLTSASSLTGSRTLSFFGSGIELCAATGGGV
jgi:hypothetical protein